MCRYIFIYFKITDINDPVVISNLPLTITVLENMVIGTNVFNVSYSDDDTLQTHTFSLTSSPTSGLSYFRVSSSKYI